MINKLGSISNSRRKQMDNKKYYVSDKRKFLQYGVAQDIKPDLHFRFDDDYIKGIEWFNSGLSLEDASEELRNNNSFCKGYARGEFESIQKKKLYDTGVEYFENGVVVEKLPKIYKDNEIFMNGYNDAANGRHR